jgi:hypothetical protein
MRFSPGISQLARGSLAICLLALAGAATGASPSAEPAGSAHTRASSLAPHHSRQHDHGAPIKPPILHKHKRAHAATPAAKGQDGSHAGAPK